MTKLLEVFANRRIRSADEGATAVGAAGAALESVLKALDVANERINQLEAAAHAKDSRITHLEEDVARLRMEIEAYIHLHGPLPTGEH